MFCFYLKFVSLNLKIENKCLTLFAKICFIKRYILIKHLLKLLPILFFFNTYLYHLSILTDLDENTRKCQKTLAIHEPCLWTKRSERASRYQRSWNYSIKNSRLQHVTVISKTPYLPIGLCIFRRFGSNILKTLVFEKFQKTFLKSRQCHVNRFSKKNMGINKF